MIRIFHGCIVAYFLFFIYGCGVKANPYYSDPSQARSFTDLMSTDGRESSQ